MKNRKKSKRHLAKKWQKFAYKHTVGAIIAITIFVLMLDTAIVQVLLQEITSLKYIGMLITGVLFVSFFTAAPAVVLLVSFAESYNLLAIAAVSGFGAMIGDYMILRFAEDQIGRELKPLARHCELASLFS